MSKEIRKIRKEREFARWLRALATVHGVVLRFCSDAAPHTTVIPRRRGIQYVAPSQGTSGVSGILDRPVLMRNAHKAGR
ncbi:hypothetical protein FXB38_14885 [Bradyrhizobium cytisi]|uniref:Uncharacterized protein n=1 Tax=Bradyrhizobium cytisi TaxID=515489 RepID=A0A5S4WV47_9BRAD|nr:hypothetical protein FXB38_14885 [Bradyrhizobium cytisi]